MSYLRCTHKNRPKIESCSADRILCQKGREVLKMTKKSQFLERTLRFLVVLTKNHQNWAKRDLKLA